MSREGLTALLGKIQDTLYPFLFTSPRFSSESDQKILKAREKDKIPPRGAKKHLRGLWERAIEKREKKEREKDRPKS